MCKIQQGVWQAVQNKPDRHRQRQGTVGVVFALLWSIKNTTFVTLQHHVTYVICRQLMHKLSVEAPPKILVERYLIEIAKNYNVPYEPDAMVHVSIPEEAFSRWRMPVTFVYL